MKWAGLKEQAERKQLPVLLYIGNKCGYIVKI